MKSSSSPPSMPTALVTAPELAPVPEEPNATFEPPEETWVDVALTLSSPSFVMLSRPFPPAMPVDRVEAVSEPLVPPVPPKLNDELVRVRLALEPAGEQPFVGNVFTAPPPSLSVALVDAPRVAARAPAAVVAAAAP